MMVSMPQAHQDGLERDSGLSSSKDTGDHIIITLDDDFNVKSWGQRDPLRLLFGVLDRDRGSGNSLTHPDPRER